MRAQGRYFDNLIKKLNELRENDDSIERAASAIANSLENDGLIHIFGTGHSHMLAEEMFYRAGGLGAVNPILDEDLMLHKNASRSTELERDAELASTILGKHHLSKGDVFIIASNSGGNALIEEIAKRVKELNLVVIAITSIQHATSLVARAKGRKLHELADIVIDNLGEVGDASIDFNEISEKVAPTSTAVGAAIVNAITARSVEILIARGVKPQIFSSSNTVEGDIRNNEIISRLKSRIPIL